MIGMNKPKIMATALFAVSLALLAGCDGVSQKPEEVLNKGVEQLASIQESVRNTAADWSEQVRKNGVHKTLSSVEKIGSSTVLHVDNKVGNIEVIAVPGDEVTVTATIWSPRDVAKKEKRDQLMDEAEVSVLADGKELNIITHPKANAKVDLWKWAESQYKFSEFNIDYVIEVPQAMNGFEISTNVGELKLHPLKGRFEIHNDAGKVDILDAHITENSTIQSDVGSVRLGIVQMENGSSLKADTKVGTITASLAESLSCSLETASELGQISGAPEGKSDMNGGGPLLSLTTSVGQITIEKSP